MPHHPEMTKPSLSLRLTAEALGTFLFLFLGFNAIAVGNDLGDGSISTLGVAFAFGLGLAMAIAALGHISGGHFNPAVSLGLAIAGRFEWKDLIPYWIAQIVGGALGAAVLYLIVSGKSGFTAGGFASNGYDALSPGGYSMLAVLIAEIVLTAAFLLVILGSTARAAAPGFAPIAIGLCLTLINLIAIPVDNCSVNPARSIAPALFAQNGALGQVWLFIVAPLIGAAVGAVIWRYLLAPGEPQEQLGRVE